MKFANGSSWVSGLLVLALTALLLPEARAALDDYYYTNDEIFHELDSLQTLYPNWIRVDSIGFGYGSGDPIWNAKVSDNVQLEEDEPALWLNGSCHAEEILGINVTMGFVRELVALGSIGHPDWAPILQSMEIHVVPSNNPDGMAIVMSEEDVTYRKNLHNLSASGECQITPGIGNDSCGVDLNRNYPAWWNHGDTLWVQNGDPEQFDYFRGEFALSEPECACIMQQSERERFVAAVAYHSARTSTNHEIIIHPWEWVEGRTCPSPDHAMLQTLTRNMGDQIQGQHYEYYRNLAGSGRKGNHHNWLYSHYGSAALLVEVGLQGGSGMQPQDHEIIEFIVDENVQGLNWLCRRIIGYEVAAPGMVLHVTHAETGDPLAVRLRLDEVSHPDCVPYYRTDAQFGSYYRLLKPQPYNLHLRRHGFAPLDTEISIGNSLPTQIQESMQPLGTTELSLSFEDQATHQPLTVDLLRLYDVGADTTLTFATWVNAQPLTLPLGVYELETFVAGYQPVHRTLVLDEGGLTMSCLAYEALDDEVGHVSRSFDSLDDFVQTGENAAWTLAYNDSMGVHFEDTPGLFSASDMDARLTLAQSIALDLPVRDIDPGYLTFTEYHQLEGVLDSAFVEFSNDGGSTWQVQRAWTGPGERLRQHSLPISQAWGGDFLFAFRVKTDAHIVDSGLHISDVKLYWNADAVAVDEPIARPEFEMQVAPNPFNPSTVLKLVVPDWAAGSRAEITLHDLLGRQIRSLNSLPQLMAGENHCRVGGENLASGVYFLRMRALQGGQVVWEDAAKLTLIR
jgi:hypothetical protein